tara:strand:- start:10 stop:855 length:846 start_codon:yes stop_codon:yes gene_type:complete
VQVRSVVIASPDGPTCAEASAAAAVLRHDGVVVLKCEALEAHAPPSDNAEAILQGLMTRMNGLGLDVDQRFSFAEICHRSPRRYDVHLGAGQSESAFSTLFNALVRPVIALCGGEAGAEGSGGSADEGGGSPSDVRIIRDGLVTSLRGASAQPFHADGRNHGLFNAFLPLVPVSTQGTEFWIGSHADEGAALRLKREGSGEYIGESLLEDESVARRISAPALQRAEGIVLFDYRVIHRGRAHDGSHAVRPVFYRVYALDDTEEDTHNWPERSLDDETRRVG